MPTQEEIKAIATREVAQIEKMRSDPHYRYWIRYEDMLRAHEIGLMRFSPALTACGIDLEAAQSAITQAVQVVIGDDTTSTLEPNELGEWLDGDHKRMNLVLDAILNAVDGMLAPLAEVSE